jgi:PhnB protein
MPVTPIPEGYNSVSPYIIVQGAERLIELLKRTFDAEERERLTQPDGSIAHAEVKIGDSIVMIADAGVEYAPMPSRFHVYVPDVDAAYKRALQAGATSEREPADQFYGDRESGVIDPFGNTWWIGTHIEDVSPEELTRATFAQQQRGNPRRFNRIPGWCCESTVSS